ncbi:large ribosomal subunit protein bL32m [Anabrus simplex]|uniref:large ribosomal subunit protein bL32m n=1 Tax=Anabrus simplex TaxID=316456 RepID=UPI0035A27CC9
MAALMVRCFQGLVKRLENTFSLLFDRNFPPDSLCMATVGYYERPIPLKKPRISLQELFGDGFLWAVPRNRRTIERRWKRKFGSPDYVMKILLPKTNLLVCNSCGHHHEAGVLCPHCYSKVQAETEMMQEEIQKELGLNPVENEVVVLYSGEKENHPEEYWKGKRIVEMKKERPSWFSKNLMQPTTKTPTTSGDVKPTELG